MILDGVSGRLRREHNDRAWLSWHVAALTRVKKLPKLKDIMQHVPGRRRMSAGEIEAVTRSWLASRHRK